MAITRSLDCFLFGPQAWRQEDLMIFQRGPKKRRLKAKKNETEIQSMRLRSLRRSHKGGAAGVDGAYRLQAGSSTAATFSLSLLRITRLTVDATAELMSSDNACVRPCKSEKAMSMGTATARPKNVQFIASPMP